MDELGSQIGPIEKARNPLLRQKQIAPDLRGTVRYSLHAKVVFTWRDGHGRSREAQGYTRNISQRGAYVIAPACPSQGERVTLNFYLPALAGETRELRIDAVGRVLRVEPVGEPEAGIGFAVSNESINLCAA